MEFKVDNLQLVLFSPGIIIADKTEIANIINKKVKGLFDGDPVIIPLPEDAPPDLPQIWLKSEDGKYNLQISKNKISFFYRFINKSLKSIKADYFNKDFIKIYNFFDKILHVRFNRSAIVSDWSLESSKGGAEILKSAYIKDNINIVSPKAVDVRWLRQANIADYKSNIWIFLRSAEVIEDLDKKTRILIRIDINTLFNKSYKFKETTLKTFYKESTSLTNSIIEEQYKNIKKEI